MTLDAALRAAIAAELDARGLTREALGEIVRKALVEQSGAALEPLATILGCSAGAARQREARDQALAALAVRGGRRRLYRRHEVLAYLTGGLP